ncbi:SecC motif-containing protein [Idiomarina sp. WRN-38]|nr:SecC motif-containing protein [Idiomarina sp. H105]OAE90765.1 SecC motif-containing protein [Idiomarina sp. WRN-38]
MNIDQSEPCPCGSGKKYQNCCMKQVSKEPSINPQVTVAKLKTTAPRHTNEIYNASNDDFFELTPEHLNNWLYAPFSKLQWVRINTPNDLSTSPVMRYLELILDAALINGDYVEADTKGNLPLNIAREASMLSSQFSVSSCEDSIISDYSGENEDMFDALHYCRVLAEVADILHLKNNRLHISSWAKQKYLQDGINSLFTPMLETALYHYNWGYLDGWKYTVPLQRLWLFMLWRLQKHSSLTKLFDETCHAFPKLLDELEEEDLFLKKKFLGMIIETRFAERFLQFFGFILIDQPQHTDGKGVSQNITCLPLLRETFEFSSE